MTLRSMLDHEWSMVDGSNSSAAMSLAPKAIELSLFSAERISFSDHLIF
jgi:hypothetical protein